MRYAAPNRTKTNSVHDDAAIREQLAWLRAHQGQGQQGQQGRLNTDAGLTGGVSGAAAGTAVLPGWGTAIGAGVGLVGGLMTPVPEPVDPWVAATGFTAVQLAGGLLVGGLVLYLAVQ